MKVVNLYGAPCSGKSTLAFELVGKLRRMGLRAEHVRDIPREDVLWSSWGQLRDTLRHVANIHHAISMVDQVADVVVVEAPLLLFLAYMPPDDAELAALVKAYHKRQDSLNLFLERNPAFAYDPVGRDCDAHEAQRRGQSIRQILDEQDPSRLVRMAGDGLADELADLLAMDLAPALEGRPLAKPRAPRR